MQHDTVTLSTDGHRDVDAQVARRVSEKSSDVGVKNEAVAGSDSCSDAVMHTPWCRFPCQSTLHAIQLQSANTTQHVQKNQQTDARLKNWEIHGSTMYS